MKKDPQGCGAHPRMHKRAVALQESKLLAWKLDGQRLTVRLDAYIHVSQGQPGVDAGTAWEQAVELVLEAAAIDQAPAAAPLWLLEATVALGAAPGAPLADGSSTALLALPLEHAGQVRLSLAGEGGRLLATGQGLTSTALGEPRFVERFAGGS